MHLPCCHPSMNETDLGMCLVTGGGLCKMSQALYPSDRVDWCIYALFKEDQAAIDKHCTYNCNRLINIRQDS